MKSNSDSIQVEVSYRPSFSEPYKAFCPVGYLYGEGKTREEAVEALKEIIDEHIKKLQKDIQLLSSINFDSVKINYRYGDFSD